MGITQFRFSLGVVTHYSKYVVSVSVKCVTNA